MIRVVYKKPNEKPFKMKIENTLEKFQELVDGFIEAISANENKSILMIVNEEGNPKNLQPNIRVGDTCIVGNIIFVQKGNDGEYHSLSEDNIKSIINMLS